MELRSRGGRLLRSKTRCVRGSVVALVAQSSILGMFDMTRLRAQVFVARDVLVVAGEHGQVPVVRDHESDGIRNSLAKVKGRTVPVAETGQQLVGGEGSIAPRIYVSAVRRNGRPGLDGAAKSVKRHPAVKHHAPVKSGQMSDRGGG